jgi:hypothetical protein
MAAKPILAKAKRSTEPACSVEQLTSMPAPEMAKLWEQRFSDCPPCRSQPQLLRLLLSARLQDANSDERAGQVRKRLVTLAAKFANDPDHEPSANLGLQPGIELVRVWKGETQRVWVLADGFLWRGTKYASLSVIAREITGTPWSGPAFFKLKRKVGT